MADSSDQFDDPNLFFGDQYDDIIIEGLNEERIFDFSGNENSSTLDSDVRTDSYSGSASLGWRPGHFNTVPVQNANFNSHTIKESHFTRQLGAPAPFWSAAKQERKNTQNRVLSDLSGGVVFKVRTNGREWTPWVSKNPLAIVTDRIFNEYMSSSIITINPVDYGFIPSYFWPNKQILFRDIVFDFFQRKNNVNMRFIIKLYNAIILGSVSDVFYQITGVRWVNDYVIEVTKGSFARLLGIKTIDGSLFHQQGNFPTNGFIELDYEKASQLCKGYDLSKVDYDDVRLLVHAPGKFVRNVPEINVLIFKS